MKATDKPQLRQKIGVIGGGQLAWMMAIAAKKLKISVQVLAASDQDPAVSEAATAIIGAIDDPQSVKELAAISDVITFENEFVDLDLLETIPDAIFAPSLENLRLLVDKFSQRIHLQQLGIATPKFFAIEQETDLLEKARSLGFPVVLKARRHGYDGKGTAVAETEVELLSAWAEMGQVPAMLEEFVNFNRELAVMVARSATGDCVVYPVVETIQRNQVCHRVIAPAQIPMPIITQIRAIAQKLVNSLDAVGIFGIEFFLSRSGTISVNEVAPRTHNSGHYSIEACQTSQFTQLLRVVSNRKLGKVAMTTPVAAMMNLLGYETTDPDYAVQREKLAELSNAHVHWYGKPESRPGRKLGHITILADSYGQLENVCKQAEAIWYGNPDA
ncbi:phosphoribosylaminoimidazole carboxylase, ATPase subunit [Thalassoporum mexicanum PCC 7367]|uniref:5-(carboxyamino)imidazole ribonucleotide synthase n=1 Tax=Thalassoporum mexicanum TaxID=3457544 RepID=UPI00029FC79E|nr:5-(carboxyamino)imidazole ribonucleotide synthase [Pseudanabaena sp. PCC 7367]AFY68603.1 phosphoribosylaminoimidazole carboxylase, ATPase subunit [Pseudanabaena sp. PCC 7367]